MAASITRARRSDAVKQFSIFTANRLGRLHDVIALLGSRNIHVLALTVLDTTDSSIIRLVVDDPEQARAVFKENDFALTESELLVVELAAATDLPALMAALLQAEVNVNYIYSFIPHPGGKSLLGLSMEDNEIAEQALRRHHFRVLKQSDILR